MNAKHFSAVIGEDRVIHLPEDVDVESGVASVVILSDGALKREFDQHAASWKRETQYLSSITDIVMHPAYQRIIGLGLDIVPLILEELEAGARQWFWALWAITGENPVPPEHQGRIEEMRQDWLRWGKENGWLRNGH